MVPAATGAARKKSPARQSPTATVEVCFVVGLMRLTNGWQFAL
jgi:hypothetical protein